jgi:hypothetical protein
MRNRRSSAALCGDDAWAILQRDRFPIGDADERRRWLSPLADDVVKCKTLSGAIWIRRS